MLSKNAKKQLKQVGRNVYKATGLVNPIKKGKVSTSRLIKDVAMLKSIINSEKFRLETQQTAVNVGQVNGNSSGHFISDFTPIPAQGDGYNNRQGNSMKWCSSHYSFLFQRQPNSVGTMTIKIQLIKIVGEAYSTPSNILGKFIEPDRWITNGTVYDIASDRKPEYFKQYRVLRTKTVKFNATQYSAQATVEQKIVNFGLKLKNHHVKFNNNSNTIADGQVICLITCDTGNTSGTTASTLNNIQNTAAGSGVLMSYNRLDYYYDN